MARGTIYYITKDRNQPVDFKEQYYYDRLDILHADRVMEEDRDSAELSVECFKGTMEQIGAITQEEEANFGFSFRFENVKEAKQNYFRPKFDQLRQKVASLHLSAIVRSAPDLNSIINDDYGDVIVMNDFAPGYTITFDDFIRKLESDVTYYVYRKTIIMD